MATCQMVVWPKPFYVATISGFGGILVDYSKLKMPK